MSVSGILADTSVWVAHFRRADTTLQRLLEQDHICCHPLVLIEIACGTPPSPRQRSLAYLRQLRQCVTATPDEILELVESERMWESGCGAVDASLMASTLLTPGVQIWTLDTPLAELARRKGVAFTPG